MWTLSLRRPPQDTNCKPQIASPVLLSEQLEEMQGPRGLRASVPSLARNLHLA